MGVAKLEQDKLAEVEAEEAKERVVKENLEQIRGKIAELNKQRSDLLGIKQSSLKVFHESMPMAVEMIRRNRSQFREMPIGPLGLHVKVKRKEWAKICEVIFGRNLNGFLVTNFEDQIALRQLLFKAHW